MNKLIDKYRQSEQIILDTIEREADNQGRAIHEFIADLGALENNYTADTVASALNFEADTETMEIIFSALIEYTNGLLNITR